jgi:hypothetical protein
MILLDLALADFVLFAEALSGQPFIFKVCPLVTSLRPLLACIPLAA